MKRSCRPVEYALIELELEDVDKLIHQGEYELTWKSQSTKLFADSIFMLSDIQVNYEAGIFYTNFYTDSRSYISDLWNYVNNLHLLVDNLQTRIQNSQANVKAIQSVLQSWCCTPVLERKDHKKDTMLDLEGRMEKFKRRFGSLVFEKFELLLKFEFESGSLQVHNWKLQIVSGKKKGFLLMCVHSILTTTYLIYFQIFDRIQNRS